MARVLFTARIVADPDTGLPIPELRGTQVQIVARGTTTPVEITEDEEGTLVISGSNLTVSQELFTPQFWVDEDDLPVAAWSGEIAVPLESVEGLARVVDGLAVDVGEAVTAAEAAQTAAEAAQAAAEAVGTDVLAALADAVETLQDDLETRVPRAGDGPVRIWPPSTEFPTEGQAVGDVFFRIPGGE